MNRTEALRLADALSQGRYLTTDAGNPIAEAAAELRRLHAELAQLREKRQPLSDAQIADCAWGYFEDHHNLPDFAEPFVRAIEAAHNITGAPA